MKCKRNPLTIDTLQKVLSEFPACDWRGQELRELIDPQYGVISGFQKIIDDLHELSENDLHDIEPAGLLLPRN